jgi:hypothetical protein
MHDETPTSYEISTICTKTDWRACPNAYESNLNNIFLKEVVKEGKGPFAAQEPEHLSKHDL